METSAASSIWETSKLLMKALIIGGLILLLLIPAYFVKGLILEREQTQRETALEITSRWAGEQNVTGPVLVIPYTETTTDAKGKLTSSIQTAYLLPDSLTIESVLNPEKKHRGIYQVMLYNADVSMQGSFSRKSFDQLKLDPQQVNWDNVYVSMGIADPKGVQEDLTLKWDDGQFPMNPLPGVNPVLKTGFECNVPALGETAKFSVGFKLNGSGQLLFSPVGKKTTIRMKSSWPDPGFTGNQLPVHQISDQGFKATWSSQSNSNSYPQAWRNTVHNLQSSAVGANMFIQVNEYQKVLRSVKYAFLCIVLTFAAFFIVETSSRKPIHPIHYGLVGLALILFYTLLLSISEYTGFDIAYLIATLATVSLIAWFVRGLLHSSRLTSVLTVVMMLLYSYIFCILQLQDLSLLLGSIGLFLSLGVVMKFSKRFNPVNA